MCVLSKKGCLSQKTCSMKHRDFRVTPQNQASESVVSSKNFYGLANFQISAFPVNFLIPVHLSTRLWTLHAALS